MTSNFAPCETRRWRTALLYTKAGVSRMSLGYST